MKVSTRTVLSCRASATPATAPMGHDRREAQDSYFDAFSSREPVPTSLENALDLPAAANRLQRGPLLIRQQRRAAGGAVLLRHARETVLGERVARQDRCEAAAFLAGDAEHQL